MTNHSLKALRTLHLMNTAPADWKQADIRWSEQERMVPGLVKCPACRGHRRVLSSEKNVYKLVTMTDEIAAKYYRPSAPYAMDDYAKENGLFMVGCLKCYDYRSRWSTGKVRGLVKRMVMVGVPQWPVGTVFDSRFHVTETNRYCCELCSKSLKSLQVPCVGTGSDGATHGMWVGQDCAKKFLPGLYTFDLRPAKGAKLGEDFVMEDK